MSKDTTEIIEKVKMAMLCTQKYSWEFGTAMQALIELGDERNLVLMARDAVIRSTPDGRLAMIGSEKNIADTGVNGPGVLAAYKITGDEKYKKAAQAQYDYLMQPTSRNSKGTIYHNYTKPVIFSDNMFMIAPFIAQMGNYDEAMRQIEAIRRVLWNEEEKLFHHIRIEETGEWRHKYFWGGGVGWCAAAMATVVDILPDDRAADKKKLKKYTTDVLDGCIAHQLPNGMFYDFITEANFEETTLGCMLAFTIYKSVKSGWLDRSYLAAAEKMRAAAHANVDEYGLMQSASGAPRFNKPGTSTEGQAFFLMMEAAYQKLHGSNAFRP
ncbi:glycoside hydrolase family 88 protein [Planctomycetota bacterium]